ncbi:MAG TPA: hypothetical protein VNA11_15525 [Pseudonocardia sp.]|nr:hypothetical protein [Pseudonocardia sp.]
MPDDPGAADGGSDLDEIADRLYAVRPDEFVPERDDAVARARAAGDRELARAIGRLRRPTRAAWLANLLARERPDQLEGLLGLAAGLADAQRTLDGSALRALSAQRHRLVAAVAAEAGRLAAARHEAAGDSLLREVGGILEAALADPAIADEVRSGRLTRTVSYSGFGPAAEAGTVPAPPRREPRPTEAEPASALTEPADADQAAARERAERERRERERSRRADALAEAEAEEAAAVDRQHADEAARDDAVEARDAAKRRVSELTEELDAARAAERDAITAAREAEVTARAAARAAGIATTATARARARLDELSDDDSPAPDRAG